MEDNSQEWPELPPNATHEQIVERGRALRAATVASDQKLQEFARQLRDAIARAQADGSSQTEEGAAEITQLENELAALKVLYASQVERFELGEEIARDRGYDI